MRSEKGVVRGNPESSAVVKHSRKRLWHKKGWRHVEQQAMNIAMEVSCQSEKLRLLLGLSSGKHITEMHILLMILGFASPVSGVHVQLTLSCVPSPCSSLRLPSYFVSLFSHMLFSPQDWCFQSLLFLSSMHFDTQIQIWNVFPPLLTATSSNIPFIFTTSVRFSVSI